MCSTILQSFFDVYERTGETKANKREATLTLCKTNVSAFAFRNCAEHMAQNKHVEQAALDQSFFLFL